MNFQELLSKMNQLSQPVTEEETGINVEEVVDECGMPGMPGMEGMPGGMMGNRQPDNVSMNLSMNAQGAGGIRDLMNVLKDIQDGPDGPDNSDGPGKFGDDDANMMIKQLTAPGAIIDDDFANEPDETYQDVDAVTGTGDDLHSKGAEAPKVNGGGNPRPVKTGETFKLPSGDLKIKLEGLYKDIKSR
jgi:hypothetical protein